MTKESGRLGRRNAARRKLLSNLPRSVVETLSGMERPWIASRSDLAEHAIARWDHEEVEAAIDRVLDVAKGDVP